MSDLMSQLREYGSQLDEQAAPLPSGRPQVVEPERPGLRRPWVVVAAAATMTAVLIGAVALFLGGGTDRIPPAVQVPETWTTWTAADGIPSDCACSMTIAMDGSVWIAGFDGVARFDGLEWERIDLPRPLIGEGWPDVAAAPDGSVWIQGMSFVARHVGGIWDPVVGAGLQEDGGQLFFETLIVDGAGRVWTGLEDQPGLIVAGEFVPADEEVVGIPGYEPGWGIPWSVDPSGALWFYSAGPSGADLRVDGSTVTEHFLESAIVGYGPDGSLWMGDMYPLLRDDGERLTTFDLGGVRAAAFGEEGTGWFLVHQIGEDAWILGEEQWSDPGLYRFDDGAWYRVTTEDWLPGYRLSVMLMDPDGALWISTADGTVTRYQPGNDPQSGTPVDIASQPS